jgi:hypothetical protein
MVATSHIPISFSHATKMRKGLPLSKTHVYLYEFPFSELERNLIVYNLFIHPEKQHQLVKDLRVWYHSNKILAGQLVNSLFTMPASQAFVKSACSSHRLLVRNEFRSSQSPYLLGGFGVGGIMAFEMVRRLQAQGNS